MARRWLANSHTTPTPPTPTPTTRGRGSAFASRHFQESATLVVEAAGDYNDAGQFVPGVVTETAVTVVTWPPTTQDADALPRHPARRRADFGDALVLSCRRC